MQLPQTDKIHSVSEINFHIKDLLEGSFPSIWMRGEVSNLRIPGSGHNYFSLKENNSQISAVVFRGDAIKSSLKLRNGMQVLAYGSLGVYPPQGTYQIIIRHIIDDGLGRLQLEFEQLKTKLKAEGLFEADRKRAIPTQPNKIAIITSASGAALQDFLRIIKRRNWKGKIGVFPTSVQGENAPAEMIAALNLVTKKYKPDLIILTRGGGSLEDLWAFNNENLARAVASCPIPVISAIGHEIDFVLTDFVADKRAETPSAAAEIISSDSIKNQEQVQIISKTMDQLVKSWFQEQKYELSDLRHRLQIESPEEKVQEFSYHLDQLENRLNGSFVDRKSELKEQLRCMQDQLIELRPEYQLQLLKNKVEKHQSTLQTSFNKNWQSHKHRLELLEKRLATHNHKEVLKRGYSLTRSESGQIITSIGDLKDGEVILSELSNGILRSEIKSRTSK